jgi:sec-independent protein translocase protein TatB
MEILGVGASEFVFILILALIILGPKDMQKAGKSIGKWLRKFITSDSWRVMRQTSTELRNLPTRLMREANEELEDMNKIGKELKDTADMVNGTSQKTGSAPTSYRPMPINPPPLANKVETPATPETKVNESDPKADA